MRRNILILILLVFPLCLCRSVEFPGHSFDAGCYGVEFSEHSFDSSNSECFVVEGYGSPMLRSPARPVPNEPSLWEKIFHGFGGDWWSEGSEDWYRIRNDPDWPSYVDPDYWDEFLSEYPEYYDDVKNYFDKHRNDINNPFRLSLIDDSGAIVGLSLMAIAYWIFSYKIPHRRKCRNFRCSTSTK